MSDSYWKIGDLAKRTGISVRTLHHYDAIGLLSPSHRTPSGHRLYGREEVIRLQQLMSLKQMGLSLEQVGDVIDRRISDARQVIRDHVIRLRQQIAAQQDLCDRLEAIATKWDAASAEEIMKAIEVMTMFEKYYSKEQLETLRKRETELGAAHIQEVQEEWPKLIAQVRAEMERGTDPKEPKVQALAKRWMELVREFTGGDPGITESLKNLYRGEQQFGEQQGLGGGISEYVKKALS